MWMIYHHLQTWDAPSVLYPLLVTRWVYYRRGWHHLKHMQGQVKAIFLLGLYFLPSNFHYFMSNTLHIRMKSISIQRFDVSFERTRESPNLHRNIIMEAFPFTWPTTRSKSLFSSGKGNQIPWVYKVGFLIDFYYSVRCTSAGCLDKGLFSGNSNKKTEMGQIVNVQV